jgi:hypothetical protein
LGISFSATATIAGEQGPPWLALFRSISSPFSRVTRPPPSRGARARSGCRRRGLLWPATLRQHRRAAMRADELNADLIWPRFGHQPSGCGESDGGDPAAGEIPPPCLSLCVTGGPKGPTVSRSGAKLGARTVCVAVRVCGFFKIKRK